MSEFKEFDQQGSVPERNTGAIISHAFEMYKGVFLYGFIIIIIYSIANFIIEGISGYSLWSNIRNFRDLDGNYYDYSNWRRPGLSLYYSGYSFLGILLSPLYVGLIYITNKFNSKERIEISDLFIGYRQNLGNILLYSLIVTIILAVSLAMCFLPFFFVYPLFFLGYPILLFENANAMDALSKTYNIVKENYSIFLGTALLGGIISFSGIILCGIGIIFTIFFMEIAMYSAYCAYLGKPRQIIYNK
ncbi:beta-carotene 15,15'-monooxygenase [Chryseobacterium terrae]|uniref:Beta-carotene 15,15'-monooxygenase n=1 Tax=Chryseobacterium terrae TaxID=3163299 RepID=A0ABW8Y5X1_9FLAO